MEIKLNDIFQDNEDYSRYAKYAIDNRFIIKELESVNDIRQFQVVEIEKPTFEELKEAKLIELNNYTNKFDEYKCNEMYITSSLGYKFNADIRSQKNIEGLISLNETTVKYKDYDNEFRTLSKSDLETLLNECIQNGLSLYQQKWILQHSINDCTNEDELNKIELEFTMSDFT